MHESGGRPGGYDRLVLLGAAGTGEKLDRSLADGDLAPHDDPLFLGVDPDLVGGRQPLEFRMAIRGQWLRIGISTTSGGCQHEHCEDRERRHGYDAAASQKPPIRGRGRGSCQPHGK